MLYIISALLGTGLLGFSILMWLRQRRLDKQWKSYRRIYDSTFENLQIGMLWISPDFKVLDTNSVICTWFPDLKYGQKALSMQISPRTNTEDSTHSSPTLSALMDGEIHRESYQHQVQNEIRHYEVTAIPFLHPQQGKPFILELWQDLSEFQKMKLHLEQSRKLEIVGQLTCGIAHDFNNILQVINGHTEMLLQFHEQNPSLQRSLDIILNAGTKASALTKRLLLFSRKQDVETKPVEVNQILEGMQRMLARLMGENIQVEMNLEKGIWPIEADENQIEQMMMNLAINARDAMPKGGTIRIGTANVVVQEEEFTHIMDACAGQFVRISVTDSGTGISPSIREQIFEPFFTTKQKGLGTGLGLATIYATMKSHGGFIDLESQEGTGSTFHLYYPAGEMDCNLEEIADDMNTQKNGNMERILFVEDDLQVGEFATEVLQHFRYQVIRASTLQEAKDILTREQGHFDLILSDFILPDGTGGDFLLEVGKQGYDIPAILCSGYSEERTQIGNLEHKNFIYLPKPYTLNDLLDTCRTALKKT